LNPDYADRLAWPATDRPARPPQELLLLFIKLLKISWLACIYEAFEWARAVFGTLVECRRWQAVEKT
jgi:hypothetical protein